ncbi:LysM peptidoglycan-binding domain-containing C40 family peptidase [Deinococcus sp. YIM 134068]|uniref:LysM peptidoglycan-binding domain-containing C40 family peptidase n=1 Tax=Deinococcus lichenicola TaxID=3118910 RepID=UPI002F93F2F3
MNALRILLTLTALTSGASVAAPYTVKAGDTLYSVAQKFGMEPVQVMQLNGLPSPTLQVGQTLEVGGAEAAAPVTATTAPAATRPAPRPAAPTATLPKATPTPAPQAAAPRGGSAFIRTAATRFLGIRYALGSAGGLDCSGFTMRVFGQLGVRLPRTAAAQWRAGVGVSRRDLRAGDLVFFNTTGRVASHVGIYLGDGLMANANSYRGRTVIEPLFGNAYWANRYVGARRILS